MFKRKLFSKKSFDTWELSFFPYLLEMYKIVHGDDLNPKDMYIFFKYLYDVSSGDISPFLIEMDNELQQLYTDYYIKRQDSYINE